MKLLKRCICRSFLITLRLLKILVLIIQLSLGAIGRCGANFYQSSVKKSTRKPQEDPVISFRCKFINPCNHAHSIPRNQLRISMNTAIVVSLTGC